MRSVAMLPRSDYDYAAQDAQVPARRRIRLIALYPEAIMHSPHPVARARPGASTASLSTNKPSEFRLFVNLVPFGTVYLILRIKYTVPLIKEY